MTGENKTYPSNSSLDRVIKHALSMSSPELHSQLKHIISNMDTKSQSGLSLEQAMDSWIEQDFLESMNKINCAKNDIKEEHLNQVMQLLKLKDIIIQVRTDLPHLFSQDPKCDVN